MHVRDNAPTAALMPKFEDLTAKQRLAVLGYVYKDTEKTIAMHQANQDVITHEINILNARIAMLNEAIDTNKEPTDEAFLFPELVSAQRHVVFRFLKNDSEKTIRMHASSKDLVHGDIQMLKDQLKDINDAMGEIAETVPSEPVASAKG